ncbi:hypothetical protein BGS_0547 [Beggiatoa sp. SS]|nr:hypothetical protein BGS_0547 [Beggiatoa sp. SS]
MNAMHDYDQALPSARERGYRCNEALVIELAAKLWLAQPKKEFVPFYLKSAHYAYGLGGGNCKSRGF